MTRAGEEAPAAMKVGAYGPETSVKVHVDV